MFKGGAPNPVVGVNLSAHAADNEKVWMELLQALKEALVLIRRRTNAAAANGDAEMPMTKAMSSMLNAFGWHTKVYTICLKSQAAAEYVYNKFHRFVEADLKTNVAAPIMQSFSESSSKSSATRTTELAIFTAIGRHYEQFCAFRRFANVVLSYLNSHYVQRNHKHSIEQLMNVAFYQVVYVNVKDSLATVVLSQIRKYRDGEVIQMVPLQNAIRLFADIASSNEGPMSPSGMSAVTSASSTTSIPAVREHQHQEAPLKRDLLGKYIIETRKYYTRASEEQMMSPTQAQGFVSWCNARLKLEEQMVGQLLPGPFWMEVKKQLFDSMLAPFVERVVTHPLAGLRYLVETSQDAALVQMYEMMQNVQPNGPKVMGNELQVLIESDIGVVLRDYRDGVTAAAAAAASSAAVGGGAAGASTSGPGGASAAESAARDGELRLTLGLSSIWMRYSTLVEQLFANDKYIRTAINGSFVQKCNEGLEIVALPGGGVPSPSLGEIFASHVDLLCRRELKDASLVADADGETRRIDVVATFLMFLKERDVFQECHRGKLAKRLLQTTPNMDLENQVIGRLQRSLGKTYTFKMEAMVRDYALTGELQRLYMAEQASRGGALKAGVTQDADANGAELSVHVLTASHWPAYRCDPMQPPKSLSACLRMFQHFYTKQHSSRTLSWVHTLGTAQLQVLFPKGVKDIACSEFQACILLSISAAGARGTTIADVARALNLPLPMIKMHTASMYLHKIFSLLTLVDSNGTPCPPNRQMHDGDLLAINPGFVHKLRKFKLAAPITTKKEGEPGRQEIDILRKAQADAAIVRIMKSRRTLMFPELEEQATQQLSKLFLPTPKLLKLRVEDLIARGYLRRDEGDRNTFHYVA